MPLLYFFRPIFEIHPYDERFLPPKEESTPAIPESEGYDEERHLEILDQMALQLAEESKRIEETDNEYLLLHLMMDDL